MELIDALEAIHRLPPAQRRRLQAMHKYAPGQYAHFIGGLNAVATAVSEKDPKALQRLVNGIKDEAARSVDEIRTELVRARIAGKV